MYDVLKVERGTIWWYNPGKSSQTKPVERGILTDNHPLLVISTVPNSIGTCTVTCLPITSATSARHDENKIKDFYLVQIEIPGHLSFVCCNSPKTIVTNHLSGYIGRLSDTKMAEVEASFARWIGFKHITVDSETKTGLVYSDLDVDTHVTHVIKLDETTVDSSTTSDTKTSAKHIKRKYNKILCKDIKSSNCTTYNSVKEASVSLNIPATSIYKCINHGVPTHGLMFMIDSES